ncbi:phosducin-like protein [Cavenderia fasciculata]|uniref:Phosducin-like protein n=1 Tax=Cavenderia fasciculata TaxID=261658 RepID=F4Q8Q7_CACFS|nr:phosducin-like protein [Cavenderia fasciculata]EGG15076.1 phosducin-like protein [Cavenderia fasciculata]|eukprot:XP_004351796.1 phosducin-like protein [Cavenderia fasciculata]
MSGYNQPPGLGKTEWEDIQIRLGNMKAPPKKLSEDELFDLIQEAASMAAEQEKQDKLNNATLDEIDEMKEDADDDEEMTLEKIRKKRIAEMKKQAELNKFGEVYHITEPSYKREVTEVKNIFVIVHLFNQGIPHCQLVNDCLNQLAPKFKACKFVKIRAEEAIHGYPDKNLPTILIYRNGDIVSQLITLRALGGDNMTLNDLEFALAQSGAIKSDLEKNPKTGKVEDPSKRDTTPINLGKKKYYDSDESDEDD